MLVGKINSLLKLIYNNKRNEHCVADFKYKYILELSEKEKLNKLDCGCCGITVVVDVFIFVHFSVVLF